MERVLPQHVAFIMDGNGRWANRRGLARIEGHRRGLRRVKDILQFALDTGIKYLTFYAFSTENWKRPQDEVLFLMEACERFISDELASLVKNDIRLKYLGRIAELPLSLQQTIERACELTKNNKKLCVQLAFNYGSRAEIVDGVRSIAESVARGEIRPADIDEAMISRHLYTSGVPDPDLLVRTSGEMRLSNFLLWQACYTELYVTDKFWPDFDRREFLRALNVFRRRSRRFGGLHG